ncbi:MAG: translation initiation factor IF-3 [Pseudomonadota bacterium]
MAGAKKNRVNGAIDCPAVRLIGADGDNLGVMDTENARREAEAASLDLVEIVPAADPPVCRLMDFGKFLFDENKKKQAAKKKQKQIQVKEIKFRPGTDEGDYQVKLKNLRRFLEGGDKVKVTLRFRGREMAHQELGADMLKRVEGDLEELGSVEQYPKLEGRQMVMVIAPKR